MGVDPPRCSAILGDVDVSASMEAPCAPERLFELVERLDDYPAWMPLTHRVAAKPDHAGRPAWEVELRARVGPLARSKRLTMVRTEHDASRRVAVFERHEPDSRQHSAWVMRATVVPTSSGSRLDMQLHYGGGLWTGGLMERVLSDQIKAGRVRLLELIASPMPPSGHPPAAPG